ncbi:hypothetical protein C1H46_019239 [Malus baccata]|uniref:Uncharacterized protein n=1 Tax=Malus baccata TaxID=106549 RepID=A0A540M9C7_MALBA|nr:hypothetical protein C1H46_019239 [Malus baccata]
MASIGVIVVQLLQQRIKVRIAFDHHNSLVERVDEDDSFPCGSSFLAFSIWSAGSGFTAVTKMME